MRDSGLSCRGLRPEYVVGCKRSVALGSYQVVFKSQKLQDVWFTSISIVSVLIRCASCSSTKDQMSSQ